MELFVCETKSIPYQVTWELQPTPWESEIDIIKELFEEQNNSKEHSEAENSSLDFPTVTVSCFLPLSCISWHYTSTIDNMIGHLSVLNVLQLYLFQS